MIKKVITQDGKEFVIINYKQAQSQHNGLFIQPLDIPKHALIDLIQKEANLVIPSLERMTKRDLGKVLTALIGK
jgi:hypothetical protein